MPRKKTSTVQKKAPKEPREVIRVIEAREIIRQWRETEQGGHIEIREHRDGSWTVHYPEAGWIPCEADCKLRHTHIRERPFTQINSVFASPEEAYEIAVQYAGSREIQIVQLEPNKRPRAAVFSMTVPCDWCGKEYDVINHGAKIDMNPYDRRRKTLVHQAKVCDECADSLPASKK